jgi:hypothetical protein
MLSQIIVGVYVPPNHKFDDLDLEMDLQYELCLNYWLAKRSALLVGFQTDAGNYPMVK